MKKENLPSKICPTCNRPFVWRKKWKLNWDQVTDDEEEQEGGGLTKEEIQKWFEYFANEINENDDSPMDDFSLPTLSKEENETLLKLF